MISGEFRVKNIWMSESVERRRRAMQFFAISLSEKAHRVAEGYKANSSFNSFCSNSGFIVAEQLSGYAVGAGIFLDSISFGA